MLHNIIQQRAAGLIRCAALVALCAGPAIATATPITGNGRIIDQHFGLQIRGFDQVQNDNGNNDGDNGNNGDNGDNGGDGGNGGAGGNDPPGVPTPEPGSLALFATALALVAAGTRRSRR